MNWSRRLHALRQKGWLYHERLERHLLYQALKGARYYAYGRLLDLGCGNKPYASLFQEQVQQYLGLDYPPARHMLVEESQADIYGAGEHLPLANESVDTVLCTQVLEHTTEPWRVMSEIVRVLRSPEPGQGQPGGRLIMTAPLAWRLHGEPHDYYRFTRYGLAYLAERSGLEIIKLCPRGNFPALSGAWLSSWLYDAGPGWLSRKGWRWAYWLALALLIPAIAFIQLTALLIDWLLPSFTPERDTLGYLMVASKRSL